MSAQKPVLYSSHGFNAVVTFTECRQTDIAFAAGAKTTPGVPTTLAYTTSAQRTAMKKGHSGFSPINKGSVDSSVNFQSASFRVLPS